MTSNDQLSLAVIIVNYRTADLVIANLGDVLRALSGFKAARIFIVDNASPTGDLEKLRTYVRNEALSESVEVIDSGANLGFAGGNNAAFPQARAFGADYVFFLNPDACPNENAVKHLAAFMEEHPKAAVAGPQILDEAGKKYASEFAFPSAMREFASESGIKALQLFTGQFRDHEAGRMAAIETDWVSGAAFIARMSAIEDMPMDDGYFLYYEETDMMLRLKKEDWEIWHTPEAEVTHIGGVATGASGANPSRASSYWFASWRRYYRKNHGTAYAVIAGLAKLLGVCVYQTSRILKGGKNYRPVHYTRDVVSECVLRLFSKN